VHVELHLVLEVFQASQDRKGVTDADLVVGKPLSNGTLPATTLVAVAVEVVEPKDASQNASAVVNSEEMLLVLLDVENDGSSDLHLGQEVEIPEDEENLALVFVDLPHVVLEHE